MLTYLGRSRDLTREDVDLDDLRASKYIYITGYLWDTENQKAAVLHAMQEANAAGVRVALSLSDPFCVNRHKEDFKRIVRDHVDVLFGNHAEAQELTGTTNPRDAVRELSKHSEVAVVTMDEKANQEIARDPAGYRAALQAAVATLRAVEWTPPSLEQALRALADTQGVPAGKIFQPIRIALTGGTVSEPANELLFVIGKEAALARLQAAAQ